MGVEAEVPVLVRILDVDAVEELGQRALAGQVSVVVGYLSVTVPVHESVLYRPTLVVVELLVEVEGSRCIADSLLLQVAAGASDEVFAFLYEVVFVGGVVAHGQLGELGVLIGDVASYHEAGFTVPYGCEYDAELDTLVLHASDIGQEGV